MNNSSLYNTAEHLAWQQRVAREAGNVTRFNGQSEYVKKEPARNKSVNHWLATAPGDSFVKKTQAQERLLSVEQKAKLVSWNRINQNKFGKHELRGYMLDSTYANASDPNSMRNTGQTRNCEYVAVIGEPLTKAANLPSMARATYDRFLVPAQPSNKTFYSFGGQKSLNQERHQHEIVSPQLLPNDTVQTRTRQNQYPKLRNELVNDYTKNISQAIFSPGEYGAAVDPKKISRARSAHAIGHRRHGETVRDTRERLARIGRSIKKE